MTDAATTDTAPTARPIDAVELSLGRLRLIGAALIAAVVVVDLVDHRAERPTEQAIGIGLAVAGIVAVLLGSYRLSARLETSARVGTIVRAQLALDVVATVATVVVLEPDPGGVLWVVVGLPVLEGALRYRLIGAVATWLAVSFLLAASVIVRWQPGQGLEPFEAMASPLTLGLALGVPAGYLAERLTAELLEASRARDDAHDRAWLLAVLTVAGNDLASPELGLDEMLSTTLDAAEEFGLDSVDVAIVSASRLHIVDERRSAGPSPEPTAAEEAALAPERPLGEIVEADDRAVAALARRPGEVLVLRAFCGQSGWRPERIAALRSLAGAAVSAHRGIVQRRELAAERARLAHEATHDELTGLLNRTGLLRALAANDGTVLFADLDGFKAINDTHGHDAGDQVLRVVAERLRVQAPAGSTVGRLGGDEFVLLVPHTDADAGAALVDRLERVVAEPIALDDRLVGVGVSIGTVSLGESDGPPEELLRRADLEMYRVKSSRRTAPTLSPPVRSGP